MQINEPVLEVDVVAFAVRDQRLRVLLMRRSLDPFAGRWALPGARVEPAERLADAGRRALHERTHLDVAYLEQLYTFDDPRRDPRGRTVSVAYYALLPQVESAHPRPGRATEDVRWWAADDLPDLAFDHAHMVATARQRLRAKVAYAPVAFRVLPERFTMRELRQVHEALSGEPTPHEPNFWRQMTSRWGLEETGERQHGRGRPAALYRYPTRTEGEG